MRRNEPSAPTVAEDVAAQSNLGGRPDTPYSAAQNVAIDVRCAIDAQEQRLLAIFFEFEREMNIAAQKATAVVIGRFQQRIERERAETRDRFATLLRNYEAAA